MYEGEFMKKLFFAILLSSLFLANILNAGYAQERRVLTSAKILKDISKTTKSIKIKNLLHNAKAIAVFPNTMRGAFLVGLSSGDGILSIRNEEGKWCEPIFVSLSSLSIGLQFGIKSTDLILVFKTERSLDGLSEGKATLDADAGVVGITKGIKNTVKTDGKLTAKVVGFGKSNGIYVGASVGGGSLHVNNNDDFDYYDDLVYVNDILTHDKVKDKPESIKFIQVLNTL